ncbi:hypothetical protein [Falsihalocynthiibacter arcticus]|nr:hypothetical protein [Falsihalocynthiibacter arcticus]
MLTAFRENAENDWYEAENKMSWWQKLTVDPPDLSQTNQSIKTLQKAQKRLSTSGDIEKTKSYFASLTMRANERIDTLEQIAIGSVPSSYRTPYDSKTVAKSAIWLSALSIPASVWSDITQARDIYSTLRNVNSNFADSSDAEIWLQSLMLPGESLAGLVSLTKGAYFESLIASKTGGELFENFNHPDTDIVIDGIAYQLKATDSEAYLNTVADNIPIIATSEVAQATEAINSGIANVDIEQATELALGGSIVDFSDTAVDALLTGAGSMGILSIIRGVGYAAQQYNDGMDCEEAIFEGVGVAVSGTAKAFVDTAELGYKALSSRPSRFVGRQIGRLASKI